MKLTNLVSDLRDGAEAFVGGIKGRLYSCPEKRSWYFLSNSTTHASYGGYPYNWDKIKSTFGYTHSMSLTYTYDRTTCIYLILSQAAEYKTTNVTNNLFEEGVIQVDGHVGISIKAQHESGKTYWFFLSNCADYSAAQPNDWATHKFRNSFSSSWALGEVDGNVLNRAVRVFTPLASPAPSQNRLVIPSLEDEKPLFKQIILAPNKSKL